MLPKKVWLALGAVGVLVGAVIAVLPVRVQFARDPLLRLRDLDPELSPPAATAECGSPARSINVKPRGTSLYELARARACQDAGRRRLLIAWATGDVIVIVGLIGIVGVDRGGHRPSKAPPAPVPSGGREGMLGTE